MALEYLERDYLSNSWADNTEQTEIATVMGDCDIVQEIQETK